MVLVFRHLCRRRLVFVLSWRFPPLEVVLVVLLSLSLTLTSWSLPSPLPAARLRPRFAGCGCARCGDVVVVSSAGGGEANAADAVVDGAIVAVAPVHLELITVADTGLVVRELAPSPQV